MASDDNTLSEKALRTDIRRVEDVARIRLDHIERRIRRLEDHLKIPKRWRGEQEEKQTILGVLRKCLTRIKETRIAESDAPPVALMLPGSVTARLVAYDVALGDIEHNLTFLADWVSHLPENETEKPDEQ